MARDKGKKIRVIDKSALGVDFSDSDAARARDAEVGRETETRERQEELIEKIKVSAVTEQDPKALQGLRTELLPLTDKRTVGRRVSESANQVLKSIERKLAYLKHFPEPEEEIFVGIEAPVAEQPIPEVVVDKVETDKKIEVVTEAKDKTLDERIDEIGKFLGDTLIEIRDHDDVWIPGTSEKDRASMIIALVGNPEEPTRSEEYTEGEVEQSLSPKGKQIFFDKIKQLRAWSKEMNKLTAEREAIEIAQFMAEHLVLVTASQEDARKRDLKRAQDLAKSIALDVAADKPPIPPPDVETTEALRDMERVDDLCDEVEAALNGGLTDGVYPKFDEMLLLLTRERARLETLEKSNFNKDKRSRLGSRLENATNRCKSLQSRAQGLLRRTRPILKEEHGIRIDGEMPEPAHTEVKENPETALLAQLKEVTAEIQLGHKMLSVPELNATAINEHTDSLDAKLVRIQTAVDEVKRSGKAVAMLDERVREGLSDLRRLQARAERHIADLTQAELLADAGTLDLDEEEPKVEIVEDEPVVIDDEETQEVTVPTIHPDAGLEEADTFDFGDLTDDEIPPKTGFAKVRETLGNAWSHVRYGWRQVGENVRQAGENQLWAAAQQEMAPKPKEATRTDVASSLLQGVARIAMSAGLTYSGTAVIPDAYRYFTQKAFTKAEKAKIARSAHEAMDWQGQRNEIIGDYGGDELIYQAELKKRTDKAMADIEASPYSAERKNALRSKIEGLLEQHRVSTDDIREQQNKEVAKALEAYITTNISGVKVAKEALNSGLTVASYVMGGPVVLAGARAASFSVASLMERQLNAKAQVVRGERTEARLATAIQDGFKQWWSSVKFEGDASFARKSLNFAKATSQLGRAVGMASALAEGVDVIDGLLERFADAQLTEVVATEPGVTDSNGYVDSLEPKVATPVIEAPDREVEAPVITPPIEGGHTFRGEIPSGSRVIGGSDTEGITYVLKRVIKSNPEAYGFDGESDIGAELFAKRMAIQITEGDGQMRRWLTSRAADKLNLFPELVNGEWHIAAVVDGKKLSMDELAELGYTSKAPASSK